MFIVKACYLKNSGLLSLVGGRLGNTSRKVRSGHALCLLVFALSGYNGVVVESLEALKGVLWLSQSCVPAPQRVQALIKTCEVSTANPF